MKPFVYRGKWRSSVTESKWVYGCLSYFSEQLAVITNSDGSYYVDPQSIGVCTTTESEDFTKEIFTGDVIRVQDDYDSLDGFTKTFTQDYLCVWNDESRAFGFYYIDPNSGRVVREELFLASEFFESGDWWIVGNKYDNPLWYKDIF